MKLIFGLGNPGKEYTSTWHNVGFDVLDSFAVKQTIGFITKSKFSAEIAEWSLNGEKILIAKPTTFYNSVGESLQKIMSFYNITAEDCLIVHDELAIPFGTVRIRKGGSDAGNNGIKSINSHGGQETLRLRVGAATDLRDQISDYNFVLSKLTQDENTIFNTKLAPTIHAFIESFANGAISATTHQIDTES